MSVQRVQKRIRTFIISNLILTSFASSVYIWVKKRDEERYRNDQTMVMEIIRGHKGAAYFLGEPIVDKSLSIRNIERNGNDLTYKGIVKLSGSKANGSADFWINRKGNLPQVGQIVLAVEDLEKRILVQKGFDGQGVNSTETSETSQQQGK